MIADAEILALERHAFEAWPAEELVALDGWWLRHTRGMTRRANSVWPCGTGGGGGGGGIGLEGRIARVEGFYAARGRRPVFQLGPAASPVHLDEALGARGYLLEAEVAVEIAAAAEVAAGSDDPATRVRLDLGPSEEWLDISARRGRFADVQEIYRALLGRLGSRAIYALAERDGEPAAVALGVRAPGWFGIFSMLTLPRFRRARCGRALLRALARAALAEGAGRLYLQVERDNTAARALYRRAGFEERYGYHYRVG